MSDNIPFALQEEIMKRLPTKSLLRFRTVSKAWKSLIDSSRFVVDYSVNHTHQHHLLVRYSPPIGLGQKYVSIVDDEIFPEHKCSLPDPASEGVGLTIVGSCQGLFCIYTFSSGEYGRSLIYTASIWNPSIRKTVAIDVSHVSHVLDPDSDIVFGFGVCPHTGDPKLVKVNFRKSKRNLDSITFTPWQVEVYTLSSQVWRSIPTINQPRNSVQLLWDQVVIDGLIYWLAIDGRTTGFPGYNMIVSFDMTSEKFMEVSLPATLAHAHDRRVVISKLKESLVAVELVREAEKRVYSVWMMEDGVPNSFTKLFTINLPDVSIQRVLGIRKNDEPIFATRPDDNAHDVFIHELHSEHISYTRISGHGTLYSAGSYMETLLLLDH
ncbi:putative F-box domain-containing protein [Helianthus annuus]|uniref:F-box domain-containing protein n=1 Tax=Helianthus annuus TaxID=4232 RepID=A0A251U8Y3_HELAN|nr:putative F-box protein At1g32420 [Helianthus annuus]KAF5797281.1 putative F-box domain-containing protein [Helianthus annuus]KAJ0903487.1 putative F-box domain-containing protein [Helianthus annuus]KAJ0906609.1 putative F-box domain-containing protein [Helianthus annuus]